MPEGFKVRAAFSEKSIMNERPRKNERSQFLSGWKEIANYLRKGTRTVQRYERKFGLPVRRPAGKPWGSVLATRGELDAWANASSIREAYRLATPVSNSAYPAREIRRGLAEMIRLREQMFELRREVTKSIQMLHQSVCELQDGLGNSLSKARPMWHEDSPLYTRDERDSLDRRELGLLNAPTKYSRAS
jgi:hypothetical protein